MGDEGARAWGLEPLAAGAHEHAAGPDSVHDADDGSFDDGFMVASFDDGGVARPESPGVEGAIAGGAVGDSQSRWREGEGGAVDAGDEPSNPDSFSPLDDPEADVTDDDTHEVIDVVLLVCVPSASASAAHCSESELVDAVGLANNEPPPEPRAAPNRHTRDLRSSCCV